MSRAETPGTSHDDRPGTPSADRRPAPQRPPGQQPPGPAGLAAPAPPQHKLAEMTTSELVRRRRELEHAITHIPGTAPVQADLRKGLDEVEAEERSRAKIAATIGKVARCAS
jgi:hypothetical protein